MDFLAYIYSTSLEIVGYDFLDNITLRRVIDEKGGFRKKSPISAIWHLSCPVSTPND